jgi:hypothetical protein
MPEYKFYSLDDAGHVVNRHDVACADDSDAFKMAHAFSEAHQIEVWELGRRLYVIAKGATLPPDR